MSRDFPYLVLDELPALLRAFEAGHFDEEILVYYRNLVDSPEERAALQGIEDKAGALLGHPIEIVKGWRREYSPQLDALYRVMYDRGRAIGDLS